MLAGFLLGFVHDRRLMREAQADIAIRRFIGCGLQDRLPDHSSLTRIRRRRRRGEARLRKIFRRTVSACVDAGIAKGEVVHVDATLIRADAGWKSMVDRHADAVASGNGDAAAEEGATDGESKTAGAADGEGRKADARPAGKRKKAGKTDADASLATSRKGQRPEPCFKQHTAVDDENGVVLDVAVTTGEAGEGDMIEAQVDEVRAAAGQEIGTVTADAGYAFAKVYGGLERRGIDPLIPAKREPAKSRAASPVPLRREARHHEVPSGQGAASGQAPETRSVLPRQGEGLRALPAQRRLPVQAEPVQDGGHRRRLSGAAARPRKHEDPVLPDSRRDQPEAARGRFPRVIPRLRPDSDARNLVSAVPARWTGRIRQMRAGFA